MGMHTWPLYNFLTNLVVLPSSSSDPLPGSHTYSGHVSQPCRRPTSRPRGRAAFPAVRTARPGECWALHDRPALAAPSPRLPAAGLYGALRPRPCTRRTARPPCPTAVEGPAATHLEATYPDGLPGSYSNRDQLCQGRDLPGISSTLP